MRVAFVGASALTIATAAILLKRHHEVVIVEWNKAKIDALREQLDCGFVFGDGSKPAILREVGPADTEFLLCLTNNDRDNILAALVGRSLGFPRVVPKIEDPEFEHMCVELGLADTIIPDRTISRTLVDMISGRDTFEISTYVKGEARFFSFVAREEDVSAVDELDLPDDANVMCLYRDGETIIPDRAGKTRIRADDEVVIVTREKNLERLAERWNPGAAGV